MSTTIVVTKPRLTLAQIVNMSVGFFGIQFAFGLQNANVSRIFQTLGREIDSLPILWIAAPITGLLVQPIIGHMSDKTWLGKLGRRRPYFMAGAICASIALFIFPNVSSWWFAAIMLWLLDASINVSMEPFRAFVGDMLPNEQRTSGFAAQTFFIGLGAFISSWLPELLTWMNVANEAPPGVIPDSVKYSFYIGGIVYVLAIAYTVFTTTEYSPEQLRSYTPEAERNDDLTIKTPSRRFLNKGLIWLLAGIILTLVLYFYNKSANEPLEKELYVLAGGIAFFGLLQLIASALARKGNRNGFLEIMDDMNFLPDTMKKLAWVQFFSWFALFSMWIYSTPALAQHIGNTTDPTSTEYNRIANWVGRLFAFYNLFAACFAFLLPVMARKFSRPPTHMIALFAGGLGLISYYFFKNENLLLLSMAGIGLAWCSILAMPYAMLTQTLPSAKMGVYMGIFNFFIVLPQILAATILGVLTKHLFNGNAIYSIVVGGCAMIFAGLLTLRIKDRRS